MLKACSRCGKVHDYLYTCTVGKERKFAKTPESRLRSRASWQRKRETVKEAAYNLCEVCRDQGVYNFNSLEIHHIIKLKQDPNGLLNDNNLICLCSYHHKLADAGELTTDYLYKLVALRDGDNIKDRPPRQ